MRRTRRSRLPRQSLGVVDSRQPPCCRQLLSRLSGQISGRAIWPQLRFAQLCRRPRILSHGPGNFSWLSSRLRSGIISWRSGRSDASLRSLLEADVRSSRLDAHVGARRRRARKEAIRVPDSGAGREVAPRVHGSSVRGEARERATTLPSTMISKMRWTHPVRSPKLCHGRSSIYLDRPTNRGSTTSECDSCHKHQLSEFQIQSTIWATTQGRCW